MRIRIYSTIYTTPLSREILDPLLAVLPGDIAAKAGRYRLWQDAHACIFGRLLLAKAMQEEGRPVQLQQLQYTAYGRPYLSGAPDFNISHSAHRVVCAIASEGRIGIDLEERRDLNIEDFRDQFSPEEWQAITQASEPLRIFYHFWTAKECLSKADGRGLNIPLAGLVIEEGKATRVDGRSWHLQTIDHFPGYACHVASESPADEVIIKEIAANDLSVSTLEDYRNYPT